MYADTQAYGASSKKKDLFNKLITSYFSSTSTVNMSSGTNGGREGAKYEPTVDVYLCVLV